MAEAEAAPPPMMTMWGEEVGAGHEIEGMRRPEKWVSGEGKEGEKGRKRGEKEAKNGAKTVQDQSKV